MLGIDNGMGRRDFLKGAITIGGVGVYGFAKFAQENPESFQDSDGDGVPDEDDYAPEDASVQSYQDEVGTVVPRHTLTPSRTENPPSTVDPDVFDDITETVATTEEENQLEDIEESLGNSGSRPTNSLLADYQSLRGRVSHFTEFSLQSATVKLVSDNLNEYYPNGAKILIFVNAYPDGTSAQRDVYGYGLSDRFDPDGDPSVTVDIDVETVPESGFHLFATLIPGDSTLETVSAADAESLNGTDRLVVSNGILQKQSSLYNVGDLDVQGFSRKSAEGSYLLEFSGDVDFSSWDATMVVYKNQYVARKSENRDRWDYAHYAQSAEESGSASTIASILDSEARRNGYETKRQKVEFVIDFVQTLPYVPDDVSTGFDEYSRYPIETLTYGGGDCEDSAILLASTLQADPFNYDCILVGPPGHMAVGIYGEDLPGTYYRYDGRRYYYLETTGDGWDVGEIPSTHEGTADLYPV